MSHRILSLDLGATLGWCYIKDNIILSSGEADHQLKGRRKGSNLIDFRRFLNNFVGVDEVFYEEITFLKTRNSNAVASFFAWESYVHEFICENNLLEASMTPNEWKKILTGKSFGGEKGEEKNRICSKIHSLGWKGGKQGTPKRSNEADAIGLAIAIMRTRGKDLEFNH